MSVDLLEMLPADWRDAMKPHLDPAVVAELGDFVAAEYAAFDVFPPLPAVFAAFRLCPLEQARVLILGQDPYHKAGQAHGLSFSVPAGVSLPPSLRQVYKEMGADLGIDRPTDGDLTRWARQGVLLLNAVLTVRAATPASHAGKGWEHLTDAAIAALNDRPQRVVFLLWGAYARKKAALVTASQHVVLEAGHPSPMNPKGFLGCRPFSAANAALIEAGESPIAWA
jgi:uracil-DNA glycosylase